MPNARLSLCGATCKTWQDKKRGFDRGTSRLVYVRCRRCVDLVRAFVEGVLGNGLASRADIGDGREIP